MQRSCAALSPKLKLNTHPKNVVRWKPGTPGFWKPKYGASKMKWQFTLPYVREYESLHHYPDVSRITGQPINWYHGEPQDGYDGMRIYGDHTLKLHGMPMGKTPEYMQERLRRFFAKFGPVRQCRAEPHPMDPYQCEGTAYVTFDDRKTALKALAAPLKFPASLHDKVVSMKHLESGKTNDPDYYEKSKFWNRQLKELARKLHMLMSSDPSLCAEGRPVALIGTDLLERELVQLPSSSPGATRIPYGRGGVPISRGLHDSLTRLVPAGPSVHRRFGSWENFLTTPPMDELFTMEVKHLSPLAEESDTGVKKPTEHEGSSPALIKSKMANVDSVLVVRPRLVTAVQRSRILVRLQNELRQRLEAEFSIWWREGKVELPEYTQRRVDWWLHKPKLPMSIQIMSRSKDHGRIFDERFLFKMQLKRKRHEERKERIDEIKEARTGEMESSKKAREERRQKAIEEVEKAKCVGLLGVSPGLVHDGWKKLRASQRQSGNAVRE